MLFYDYNLKTETESEMLDVLVKVFGVDEEGNLITSTTSGDVVLLPNLSKQTDLMLTDDDGNECPEYVKVEGFHANARMRMPNKLLESISIQVETPLVKFA